MICLLQGGSYMETNLQIGILPNEFLNEDGTFAKERALNLSGKIAGVCYDKEGFNHLLNESEQKTLRRIDMTLNNGHHSVYDHIMISFNIRNIPKILAMILNNEHEYTTSEKSARYTKVERKDNSFITSVEEELYNKWLDIFFIKIKDKYGNVYSDSKIKKLAQENARYLVTVFMPTEMIYTTSLRQINYIASWLIEYSQNTSKDNEFGRRISLSINDFIKELERLNILEPGLMQNEKARSISLFNENVDLTKEYFGNVYATKYQASFAYLAQAQRHRTLDYQMKRNENKEYFVPPIIMDDTNLTNEWLRDIESVSEVIPQGELVTISEMGKYEDFILKCKERLCSEAQLEIMKKTRELLLQYRDAIVSSNHYLKEDIIKYTKGARCTFPDFTCHSDCHFNEGKTLVRKI